MLQFDYEKLLENPLDSKAIESIENSKLITITKLFCIVVVHDGIFSSSENQYIIDYYLSSYPESVAYYLFKRFNDFVRDKPTLNEIPAILHSDMTYGEKIFILMKITEIIMLSTKEISEFDILKEIIEVVGINNEDLDFIIRLYMNQEIPKKENLSEKIVAIKFGNDPGNNDVYLPYENLNFIALKIEKFYCIVKFGEKGRLTINKKLCNPDQASRIPYGSNIKAERYKIDFEQLKFYFHNRYNDNPETIYFVNNYDSRYILESFPTKNSLLKITLIKSLIFLQKLNKISVLKINRKISPDESYVNLNDSILLDDMILNIKKIYYQELHEKEFIHISSKKDKFTISNYRGDIYLSDKLEKKWNSKIFRKDNGFFINTGNCPHLFWLIRDEKEKPLGNNNKKTFELLDKDLLFVKGYVIKCSFNKKVFEKTKFSFKNILVENLEYDFADGSPAIEKLSFEVDHGDLIAVMGPSGCGKTTLLNILNGNLKNNKGKILIDHFSYKEYYRAIKRYISYVPQEDLLFSNLSVYENLYFNARLRFPGYKVENIRLLVNKVIKDIDLESKRNQRVGDIQDKVLSGGERKRLNIGLELLSDANIYFLDEPTSGLSSQDSEKIIELLKREVQKGKIIFVVIHQPGSKVFKKFNKIIMLDKGGKLAYFGYTIKALRYFYRQKYKIDYKDFINQHIDLSKVEPDIMLSTMEEPLRDFDGEILPQRKYSPSYWYKEYQNYLSYKQEIEIPHKNILHTVPQIGLSFKSKFLQLLFLFERNYINKLRDRSNLVVIFLASPILGSTIGFILRYTPADYYTLYNNVFLPVFIFLAAIVSIFLAMSNSIDEIIKDNGIRQREKMLNISSIRYFFSKLLTLNIFTAVQNSLFIISSFLFLELRELYFEYFLLLTLTANAGIALGLFISSFPNITSRAAQNIVPMILIPQIIFGGAIIKYSDMNKSLTIYKNSPIPEISQIMPSRWSFEGMMVMQETYNSYHTRKDSIQHKLDGLIEKQQELIKVYGLHYYNIQKNKIMNEDLVILRQKYERKFGNREVHLAVTDGNEKFEKMLKVNNQKQLKNIPTGRIVYPLFVKEKYLPFTKTKVNTSVYNGLVLLFFSFILNFMTILQLYYKDQLIILFRRITRKKTII